MKNYKITIQYDGAPFFGWQIQAKGKTVQGEITRALETLLKHDVNLTGAGRTDSGVLALGQVANFKTESGIEPRRFLHSLNALLPFSIRIRDMNEVPNDFNSRFDAVSRSYLYFIYKNPTPFNYKHVWVYHYDLDVKKLNDITAPLKGKHDFASFTKLAKDRDNYGCDIKALKWNKTKDQVVLFVEADRFLHGMVRAITGTAILIHQEGGNAENMLAILEARDRKTAAMSAPANGLFLYKVRYPEGM